MKNNRMLIGGVLAAVVVVVVAAVLLLGGDDDDNGGGDGGGDGGGSANLSQTISTQDFEGNTLVVSYPEGWLAIEEGGNVTVGSNQAALDATEADNATFPEDQVSGQVAVFTADTLAALGDASNLTILLDSLAQAMVGSDESFGSMEFDSAEEVTISGKAGASVHGSGEVDGQSGEIIIYLLNEGDGYVMGFFASREGDLGQFNDEIEAIVGAAAYSITAGGELPTDEPAP